MQKEGGSEMGFYNDDQERTTKNRTAGVRPSLKWIAQIVLSMAVGAATTLVAVPLMVHANILPSPALSSPNLQNMSYHNLRPVTVKINDSIVQAVKKVEPAVVGVLNYQEMQNSTTGMTSLQEESVGSGVIFSKKGYIVTNYHVVQGAAKVVVVIGRKVHVTATVVGDDPYTDLAVLKVPVSDLSANNVAKLGNSATLQAGQAVFAIGNPAGLHFADSVTAGVISATQRTVPVIDEATGDVISDQTELQTDAVINPGNSGGPLCNLAGEVVGINNSKIVAHGFQGMGFSIPINEVKMIVHQILTTGHAVHAAIGIEAESLSAVPEQYQPNVPVHDGVWIVKVMTAGAKSAGLQHGDVIVAINGHTVTGVTALQAILWKDYQPGQSVIITVYRGQQKLELREKLGDLPVPSNPPSTGNVQG